MKKILITGEGSFIGTSFEKWCLHFPNDYLIKTVSLKENRLEDISFFGFDAIFHVAGIAHVSSNEKMKDLYFRINRDLAIQTAEKAKAEGIKQFVFMSSMNIFGNRPRKGREATVTVNTKPAPISYYGESKLQAEIGLRKLIDDSFKIAFIRPPMVYGREAKGNYPKLVKLAKLTPVFPEYKNKRSMIHIDNLCEFIRLVIEDEANGEFCPQNEEYVCTSHLVTMIAEHYGHKIYTTRIFNPIIVHLVNRFSIFEKLFGDFTYDMELSRYSKSYQVHNLSDSIQI